MELYKGGDGPKMSRFQKLDLSDPVVAASASSAQGKGPFF